MDPTPDGYAVRLTLEETNPAALGEDGGVGDSLNSCGGAIWSKADLLAFAPTLSLRRGTPAGLLRSERRRVLRDEDNVQDEAALLRGITRPARDSGRCCGTSEIDPARSVPKCRELDRGVRAAGKREHAAERVDGRVASIRGRPGPPVGGPSIRVAHSHRRPNDRWGGSAGVRHHRPTNDIPSVHDAGREDEQQRGEKNAHSALRWDTSRRVCLARLSTTPPRAAASQRSVRMLVRRKPLKHCDHLRLKFFLAHLLDLRRRDLRRVAGPRVAGPRPYIQLPPPVDE